MSIIHSPNICQNSNCSSLVFKDGTGAWSITNTNGYNSPNESIVGATASLIVTLADASVHTITLTGFPTIDTTLEYTITASDLGYSSTAQITDQILSVQYRVVTALTTIITQNSQLALYCQVNCCVNSMFLDIDIDCDDCYTLQESKLRKANLMLQGLKYSANCLDTTTFNKTLAQLNKICLNQECSNCNN